MNNRAGKIQPCLRAVHRAEERFMALAIGFSPKMMTAAKYDECLRRLAAAGFGSPDGRRQHLCYGTADDLRVVEIWESPGHLRRFGQVLMPILAELGIDPGQPDVHPLHNQISA